VGRPSGKRRCIFPKVPSIRLLVWFARSVKDPGKGSRRRSRWEGPGVPRAARNRPTALPIREGGFGGKPAVLNRRSRISGAEFARSPPSTRPVRRNRSCAEEDVIVWCSSHARSPHCYEEDIALSELESEEDRLRRQRAHDVARTLESLHLEGSGVDLQILIMAIAQRYVDGEITIEELTAAIERARRTCCNPCR
jgi:hypothetical protein